MTDFTQTVQVSQKPRTANNPLFGDSDRRFTHQLASRISHRLYL